jgi:hypothetical protein
VLFNDSAGVHCLPIGMIGPLRNFVTIMKEVEFWVDKPPVDIVIRQERSQEGFNKTTKVFPNCK